MRQTLKEARRFFTPNPEWLILRYQIPQQPGMGARMETERLVESLCLELIPSRSPPPPSTPITPFLFLQDKRSNIHFWKLNLRRPMLWDTLTQWRPVWEIWWDPELKTKGLSETSSPLYPPLPQNTTLCLKKKKDCPAINMNFTFGGN